MKLYFSKHTFSVFSGFLFFIGMISFVSFFIFDDQNTVPTKDPLSDILSDIALPMPMKNALGADFITKDLSPYNGPKSASLQTCIDSVWALKKGQVMASFDKNFIEHISKDEIFNEINPVFGHAVRNNQINWVFDPATLSYTFFTAPNDEALWLCYFKNETKFFTSFFTPSSLSTLPVLDIGVYSEYSSASSQEANRITSSISLLSAQQKGVPLGFLSFEPSDILDYFSEHTLSNDPHTVILSPDASQRTSSMEVLRNQYSPFSVRVFSSSEAARISLYERQNILQFTPQNAKTSRGLASDYMISFVNPLPDGNISYQFSLDPAIHIMESISSREGARKIITANDGHLITVKDVNAICTKEYAPVCGKTLASDLLTTYSNRCSLDAEGGEFLYKGECQSSVSPIPTICPLSVPPAPPEGCFYKIRGYDRISIPGCVMPTYVLACA